MATTTTCKTCLNTVASGAGFCPYCGSGVSNSKERPSGPQVVADRSGQVPSGAAERDETSWNDQRVQKQSVLRASSRNPQNRLQRQKQLVWGMISVIGAVVILGVLVLIQSQHRNSEPPVPELVVRVMEHPKTWTTTTPRNSVAQSDARVQLNQRIASFYTDWERNPEATVADWIQIAVATTDLSTLETESNEATARRAYSYAQVALEEGDLETADQWFTRASGHLPEWPYPLNGRGEIAARRGASESAARFFRAALNLNPDWLTPRSNLVRALLNMNRFSEAESESRQLLARNANSAYAHYALAMVFGQLNKPADAIRSAEEALRLDHDGSSGFDPDQLRTAISWWQGMIERERSGNAVTASTGRVASPDAYAELRTDPGGGAEVLRIPQNAEITLQNCQNGVVSLRGEQGNWCQTSYRGQTGWVFSGFVK